MCQAWFPVELRVNSSLIWTYSNLEIQKTSWNQDLSAKELEWSVRHHNNEEILYQQQVVENAKYGAIVKSKWSMSTYSFPNLDFNKILSRLILLVSLRIKNEWLFLLKIVLFLSCSQSQTRTFKVLNGRWVFPIGVSIYRLCRYFFTYPSPYIISSILSYYQS